ncbi:hypothetical protein TIFTF001_019506 [Ficus carica]|uniref:U6 snRNA-associated Sm-like protein LSm5 n=1 Tax=Ficus carica TaxID=3494 RepID=A0AA88DBU4_FICCA|nr:hypothetical protein TIFTF001_019506 [Ficus carica]
MPIVARLDSPWCWYLTRDCAKKWCFLERLYMFVLFFAIEIHSEITAEGRRITKLDQILLNGNNIAILVPGGSPESE